LKESIFFLKTRSFIPDVMVSVTTVER